jgi:hypothetical protein
VRFVFEPTSATKEVQVADPPGPYRAMRAKVK